MPDGNGKAVEIARLDEKYNALEKDLNEFKEREKEYGIKTDNNVRDLYNKLNMVNAKVVKIGATIAAVGTGAGILINILGK